MRAYAVEKCVDFESHFANGCRCHRFLLAISLQSREARRILRSLLPPHHMRELVPSVGFKKGGVLRAYAVKECLGLERLTSLTTSSLRSTHTLALICQCRRSMTIIAVRDGSMSCGTLALRWVCVIDDGIRVKSNSARGARNHHCPRLSATPAQVCQGVMTLSTVDVRCTADTTRRHVHGTSKPMCRCIALAPRSRERGTIPSIL